ncbi:Lysophospholipid acyltransferase [Savitreella phatthalungensis]
MIASIHNVCVWASEKTGFPVDPLKLLACLLISYPMAGLMKRLPHERVVVNCYCIAGGLFFLVGVFDLWTGLLNLLGASLVTYAISTIRHPLMPWINFIVVMAHMSVNQIIRQRLNDANVVDVTGAQMVLVMKLTAFAWNVHDGRQQQLQNWQKRNALKQLPSLLDYLAWVFFFPAMLIGPSFDFALYREWLTLEMYGPGARRIPRSGRAATKRAVEGILWIAALGYLSTRYDTDAVLDRAFERRGLLSRLAYLVPLAITARTKYYGVWKVSEGACILCGFGYRRVAKDATDGTSHKVKWDLIENISPREFETSPNTKALLESWNKNTNRWLKEYVYLRVTPAGRKPGFAATLATFGTSAIWHGFYPGYYFAFATGALAQTVGKLYRRKLRPYFVGTPYKRAYDIVGWVVTQLAWDYISQPFIVLGFWESILFFKRYYFFVHIGMAASFLTIRYIPTKKSAAASIEKESDPVTAIPPPHPINKAELQTLKHDAQDIVK